MCYDKIKLIKPEYNIIWANWEKSKWNKKAFKKAYTSAEIKNAKNTKKIIHFLGSNKADKDPKRRYGKYWWKYAIKTNIFPVFIKNTNDKTLVIKMIKRILKKQLFSYAEIIK